MNVSGYMPSARFSAMLAALFISSGLIYAAAQASPVFHPQPVAVLYASQDASADLSVANPNWQQQFAGDTVPQQMTDIQNQADALSSTVQGKNLTDSVAKSLAINTFALRGQGIADSADAQNQAASAVLSGIKQPQIKATYTRSDLHILGSAKDTLHTWGNDLPKVIFAHRGADEDAALLFFGAAVDTNNNASLAKLSATAAEYRALARDTITLPVPSLFAVYQLQLANNYVSMGSAIGDMQQVLADPMRGLLGLQTFVALAVNNAQILVQIDSLLKQGGAVFGKGELGASWDSYTAQAAANSVQLQAGLQNSISQ